MLEIQRYSVPSGPQWEMIVDGTRNPLNSWDKSDSRECPGYNCDTCDWWRLDKSLCDHNHIEGEFIVGPNDLNLMKKLAKAGPSHAKYRRMIAVYVDILAPLYWWKEMDTYQVGVTKNSCSTMHKLMHKEFELEDFSTEHMNKWTLNITKDAIRQMNYCRNLYLAEKDPEMKKEAWWQVIQLLPTSYNQLRTVMLNYEVLANIYETRRGHKLDEWGTFIDWIEGLPYSELITGN